MRYTDPHCNLGQGGASEAAGIQPQNEVSDMALSRRKWLCTVTAGSLGGLVAQVPIPLLAQNEGTIPENDRHASEDDSADGIVNRLQSVGRVLGNMHARMDKINAAGSQPPDDILPPIDVIKAEALAIIDVADELLTRTNGR